MGLNLVFWNLFVYLHLCGPMSLGPQNRTKKLTHLVDLLGHLLSRNHVYNFSDLGPPPPPLNISYFDKIIKLKWMVLKHTSLTKFLEGLH